MKTFHDLAQEIADLCITKMENMESKSESKYEDGKLYFYEGITLFLITREKDSYELFTGFNIVSFHFGSREAEIIEKYIEAIS